MRKLMTGVLAVIVLNLIIWGGIVYTAIHFINKFW